MRSVAGRVVRAAVASGAVSGLPSTVLALQRGESPWGAARAAGTLAGRSSVLRGAMVHGLVSLGWTGALALVLPSGGQQSRGRTLCLGLAAGAAIAAVDLGLIGRRIPEIAALRTADQVLDHLLFGVVAVASLQGAESRS